MISTFLLLQHRLTAKCVEFDVIALLDEVELNFLAFLKKSSKLKILGNLDPALELFRCLKPHLHRISKLSVLIH